MVTRVLVTAAFAAWLLTGVAGVVSSATGHYGLAADLGYGFIIPAAAVFVAGLIVAIWSISGRVSA